MTTFSGVDALDNRAEGFDGLFQLQVSSNFYIFNALQNLNIDFDWLDVDRYDTNGNLGLVRAGQNHTFEMEIGLTNDEADTPDWTTGNPPTNVRTLSYWMYQKEILKNRVIGTYVGKFVTKAGKTIVQWVTGTSYAAGATVVDPSNQTVYMAKNDIVSSSVQPHSDSSNWTATVLGIVYLRVTLDIQGIGLARPQGDLVTCPIKGRVIGITNLTREAT